MTEIFFYHLQKTNFEEALPLLLEKTLELGKRAIVKVGSSAYAERLDTHLWNYQKDSWLPHGIDTDSYSECQPIWLTTIDENPIGATFLFFADGAHSADVSAFERCFELFDGNDRSHLTRARDLWQSYKNAGHDLKYLMQSDDGKWVEKTNN